MFKVGVLPKDKAPGIVQGLRGVLRFPVLHNGPACWLRLQELEDREGHVDHAAEAEPAQLVRQEADVVWVAIVKAVLQEYNSRGTLHGFGSMVPRSKSACRFQLVWLPRNRTMAHNCKSWDVHTLAWYWIDLNPVPLPS